MSQILAFPPAAHAEPQPEDAAAEKAIIRLLDGGDIDRTAAQAIFGRIVEGSLGDPLMAAAFVALRVKGETGEELARLLGTYAIDVGSSVDLRPGLKSADKIATLFEALRPSSRQRLRKCA